MLPRSSTTAGHFFLFQPEIVVAKLESTIGTIFSRNKMKGAGPTLFYGAR